MQMNPMFLQKAMGSLSDAELAQVAQKPPMPMAQLMAIQELDQRKQMRMASGGSQPPTTTVLEDRVAESMPRPPTSGASDPIRQGLATIMQQQAQQQPPVQMRSGGPVHYRQGGGGVYRDQFMGDLEAMLPFFQQMLPQERMTPEQAMAVAQQFAGEDRLAPFEKRIAGQEQEYRDDRRRGRWLSLARAGLGMMGPGSFWGNVARGGQQGLDSLNDVEGDYREGRDRIMGQQLGLAQARSARDNQISGNAFSAWNRAADSDRANLRTSLEAGLSGANRIGASRDAALGRASAERIANIRNDDISILAGHLFRANQGRVLPMGGIHAATGGTRPYNEQDALKDAIATLGQGSGSGSAQELRDNILSLYGATRDPSAHSNVSPEVRQILEQRALEILQGPATATGTVAPSEGTPATARSRSQGSSAVGAGLASQWDEYARQRTTTPSGYSIAR